MSEKSICQIWASVLLFDEGNKKWVPSGGTGGLSRVHIYHHNAHNSFRVVGRLKSDQSVVINCAILKGLKYNQATPTFHQWRDNKQVYGLNFQSKDDADSFAQVMLMALETLANQGPPRAPPQPPPQPQMHIQPQMQPHAVHQHIQPNGPSMEEEEAMPYRQEHIIESRKRSVGSVEAPVGIMGGGAPPPAPPGPAPILSQPAPAPPAAPAPPPTPPATGAPPPPPPPPGPAPTNLGGPPSTGGGDLASAIAGVRLRNSPKPAEPSIETGGGGSAAAESKDEGRSTLSKHQMPGIGGMMGEMQAKLARRRQASEAHGQQKSPSSSGRTSPVSNKSAPPAPDNTRKPWQRDNQASPAKFTAKPNTNGTQSTTTTVLAAPGSPKAGRARGGSISSQNGVESDMDRLKQEILNEMRKEIAKAKEEIIEAIRMELSRR